MYVKERTSEITLRRACTHFAGKPGWLECYFSW